VSSVIEFNDVVAHRGHTQVLRGVSLAVASAEVVALVGRSGSGKTTMLRLVNRMLTASSGEVRVAGRDVSEWDAITLRRQTGYAIQDVGLFPHLSVAQNIAIVPRLMEWEPPRIASRIDQLLALVGLDAPEFRDRRPDQLSGGQRQRVGLARALAADPPVLLMDEPFGALDPITRAELHREFQSVQAAMHKTVLLVTHDLAEAFLLADRIAVLQDGVIVECAPPSDLRQSTHPLVQALVETRFG
jgi:osmoprotectant transport system ATP-binding protein